MVTPVCTVEEEDTIKEAAEIMVEKRIGALPVTDPENKLVGIIVKSDILRAFVAGKK